MAACCPHCHQPIASARLGVRMPPLKARYVDAIRAAGDIGISSIELRHALYPERTPSLITVRAHIHQINELLAGTDYQIACDRGGKPAQWLLVRRRKVRAA